MTLKQDGWTGIGPGRTHPVLPFFLAIFVSWLLWIPAGARAAGVLPFPWPFELAWLGVFSPLIFGLYFTMRAGGRAALASYLGRFVQWRFPAVYWAYALLAIPAAALLTVTIFAMIEGPALLSEGVQRLVSGEARVTLMSIKYAPLTYESIGPFDYLFQSMTDSAPIFIAGFLALALIDGGISEEPGWRGYAYPILQNRYGALPSALVVGFVWALWHMGPLQWRVLFADGPDAFAAFLPGYALAYFIVVMPLAIVFSWLYEASRGSLLICFIAHAVYNISVAGLAVLYPGKPFIYGVILFIWLSAIAIVGRYGWRRFSADPDRDESKGPIHGH